MNGIVGRRELVFMTLDTLRYDVAQAAFEAGETPHLARVLPAEGWEKRHSPGSFTYPAHQAFFAGFLPTPVHPGPHERLFAARFPGSTTTGPGTFVFDAPNIASGLAAAGYHTICIGGVGFFSMQTELARELPRHFHESHWNPALGVTDPGSTAHQFQLAAARLSAIPPEKPIFLFINVSAIHQPNRFYLPGATEDSLDSHRAALRYLDSQLPVLWQALERRGRPSFHIYCSDHGTAYGEEGYHGHRLAHPVVWEVPYAHFCMD